MKKNSASQSLLTLIIALAMCFTLFSCKKDKTEDPQPAPVTTAPVIKTYVVKYRVNVTGSILSNHVYYANQSGGYTAEDNISDNTEYTLVKKTGDFVYVSASNYSSPGYASVEVDIYLDGLLYKIATKNNSAGATVTCEASGTLP